MWNKNVCLTNKKTIFVIVIILFSTLLIASVWTDKVEEIEKEQPPSNNEEQMWIPTEEDIRYQDSMFCIIEQTQMDVDTIKQDIDKILYKLDRLDYDDGTYDSIRVRK